MIFLILAVFVSLGLGLFQNCSRASLQRPPPAPIKFDVSGQTTWCLDGPLQGYTVESFYVRNVNVLPWRGELLADSDADGLPDSIEQQAGFDPLNPRSQSGALDRVCYDAGNGSNQCPSVATNCSSTPGPLGLAECDIKTLGLDQAYQHPTQGLDTDKDGIEDYLEILSGTSPLVADAAQDPDHDTILNQTEIQHESNPFFWDADLPPQDLVQINSQKLSDPASVGCGSGEAWQFTISHIPFMNVMAYNSNIAIGIEQSHDAGQNLVLVVIKLRPQPGVGGNAKIYDQTFVIDQTLSSLPFDSHALQLAGEVLP